jgi:Zn-dependent peptidase ImmA (M78 family)
LATALITKSKDYLKATAQWEAEHLWDIYGISKPGELCLEDIALARGVLVTEGPLQKMDARLIRDGNRGLIRIREDIPENGRKRFATAHEMGHWELHKDISQLFECTEKDLIAKYKGSPEEIQANYFAAALLMPTKFFTASMDGLPISINTIRKLSEIFRTSLTATAFRYVELSEDYCAIVSSSDGKVQWFRGSTNFDSCFQIRVGQKLSNNTVAGELFITKLANTENPEEVDISEWSLKNDGDEKVFIEESFYISQYDRVFTILHLP